jgi:hypothetical protein
MAANSAVANIGESKIGLSKAGSTVAVALTAGLLSLSLAMPSPAAASDQHLHATKHRPHQAYVTRPRHFVHAAPRSPGGPGYSGYPYIPPNAIIEPGFVFVPGVGILGESCDLPTSSCDNAYRDVQ